MLARTAIAIAQVVCYAPLVSLTLFIFLRNIHNRPRQPWYPLILFTLMRLIGGVLTIAQEKSPDDTRLQVAASALLNVGLVALLYSTTGIVRLVLGSSAETVKRACIVHHAGRIALLVVLLLLVLASTTVHTQGTAIQVPRALALAGYVITALVVALVAAELTQLHVRRQQLAAGTLIYVQVALLGTPTLVLRTLYGLLFAYTLTDEDAMWNPLEGSTALFVLMGLIPEYITLVLYVFLGFHRTKHAVPEPEMGEEGGRYFRIGGLHFGWTMQRLEPSESRYTGSYPGTAAVAR